MADRIARRALAPRGQIVVLNGCSSAGKSSISRALQVLLPEPYLHIQLDVFRDMEPAGHWDEAVRGAWPIRLAALCRAMHATAIQYTAHGLNAILDHALTPDAWRYLAEDFSDERVWLVGVHCPLAELARREHARGDRPIGLAARQFAWIHRDLAYDLALDTAATSAAECAAALHRRLADPRPPTAFALLRARTTAA